MSKSHQGGGSVGSCLSAPVAALIATRDRNALLRNRSIPSVAQQTTAPEYLVVVNDGEPLEITTIEAIERVPIRRRAMVVPNGGLPGAAGAWNTGLEHLARLGHSGYVAILDDDDEWDAEHLEVNARAVAEECADGSISGIRVAHHGVVEPRPLIAELRTTDFLVGNPGWQGSNTFVHMRALDAAGRFRAGLPSCNDRDLAIRLLRLPMSKWVLVPRWTATWHRGDHVSLSSPGSLAKLEGLRKFWILYGGEMNDVERASFFERALRRFGFDREVILQAGAPQPGERRGNGALQ